MSTLPKPFKFVGLVAVAGLFLAGAYTSVGIIRWVKSHLTPDAGQVVARVAGSDISRSQLERAVNEQLWLEGKSMESLTPAERKAVRATALDELMAGSAL